MKNKEPSAMNCWYHVSQLIPITTDFSMDVYLKTFHAFQLLEEKEKNVTNADDIRTIADRIRVMSDEELAEFLCRTGWRLSKKKECLEWLQREADEINI